MALTELRFYDPLDTNIGHFRDVFPSNYSVFRLVLKKLDLTQKADTHNKPKDIMTQIKHQK